MGYMGILEIRPVPVCMISPLWSSTTVEPVKINWPFRFRSSTVFRTASSHTKLSQVKRGGDLKIEGEITQYTQRNKSVSASGQSAQTELSITVNVRFTNNVNHNEDFERQFSASKSYETTQSLASVQEELVTQMVKDLCEQIFNATVANW